jgi:hypothetical protein
VAVVLHVQDREDLGDLLLGLTLSLYTQGFEAVSQRYLHHVHRVPGTFDHPNSLSMYVCLTLPVVLAGALSDLPTRARLAMVPSIPGGVVAVILTISRVGFLVVGLVTAGVLAVATRLRLDRCTVVGALVLGLAGGGLVYRSWDTLQSRWAEGSLEEEYLSEDESKGRGVYLRLARRIITDHPLGIGLNNWSYAVSNRYGQAVGLYYIPYAGTERAPCQEVPYGAELDAAQAAPAHSLPALVLGELGYPGLLLFAWLWGAWVLAALRAVARTWRDGPALPARVALGVAFGLLAVSLQSLTEWEFRQTPIFLMVHLLTAVVTAILRAEARRR